MPYYDFGYTEPGYFEGDQPQHNDTFVLRRDLTQNNDPFVLRRSLTQNNDTFVLRRDLTQHNDPFVLRRPLTQHDDTFTLRRDLIQRNDTFVLTRYCNSPKKDSFALLRTVQAGGFVNDRMHLIRRVEQDDVVGIIVHRSTS